MQVPRWTKNTLPYPDRTPIHAWLRNKTDNLSVFIDMVNLLKSESSAAGYVGHGKSPT